jgi:hypothetical protein
MLRGAWLPLAAIGLWWAPGCKSEADVHPFYASRYDAASGCLQAGTVYDILDGPEPGRCTVPTCWVNQRGEIYVSSTMCDGPPDWQRTTAPEPGSDCARALELLAKTGPGTCVPEGGGSEPAPDAASQDDAAPAD